jgi:hypothetical protein
MGPQVSKGRRRRTANLKRLTAPQLQAAISAMEDASGAHLNGDHGAFDRWLKAYGDAPARLEFPLGELMNERIRGFVWAWAIWGLVQTEAITARDGFDEQGIEGKAVVQVQLVTALLVARDLPEHRAAVYAVTGS